MTVDRNWEGLRRLAAGAYFVGAFLLLTTLTDFLGNLWPMRVGAPDWRYAAVGMLSTFLGTLLLACLLVVTAAWAAGHARVLRTAGIVLGLAGMGLAGAVILFLLDAAQVRMGTSPDRRWVTTTSAAFALGKHFLGILALFTLARVSWLSGKTEASRSATEPLIMGKRS